MPLTREQVEEMRKRACELKGPITRSQNGCVITLDLFELNLVCHSVEYLAAEVLRLGEERRRLLEACQTIVELGKSRYHDLKIDDMVLSAVAFADPTNRIFRMPGEPTNA